LNGKEKTFDIIKLSIINIKIFLEITSYSLGVGLGIFPLKSPNRRFLKLVVFLSSSELPHI
ncbi:hypothetical protein, partial [uncultured Treponema sp.]|uniref:hypothetical protein n=1 Tax=uncultured Treponema sp. TaxID=162155 RepID=UPI002595A04B